MELGFDSDDMTLKSISGLNFKEEWREYILKEPDGENGKLCVMGKYESGKSYRLNQDSIWDSYFDKATGWFCTGNPKTVSNDNTVRVFQNAYIVLDEVNELKSIRIKPVFK